MDLTELINLITIRQYVINAAGDSTISKTTVTYMHGALLMIDKKIVNLLQSDDFKEYIEYKDVKKAIEESANINNIRSGLQRNPHTGQLEKIPK